MACIGGNAEPGNVSKPERPLQAFDKLDQFKLFVFDMKLLKHMAGIDNGAILLGSDFRFKGPLTENYVLQQFHGLLDAEPRYYAGKNSEIDFIVQSGPEIIPVEVKAGKENSALFFKRYVKEKQSRNAVRFSKLGYIKNGEITNIPLYLARKLLELI